MIKIVNAASLNISGITKNDCWDYINRAAPQSLRSEKFDFTTAVPKRQSRKMSRFGLMGIAATEELLKDHDRQSLQKYQIGTLFSSGYGPLDTNLDFAEHVISSRADLCSPTVFSNTVTNAVLGNICINFGLQGPSTMLLASSPYCFAECLLHEDKVKQMVVGEIEGYSSDLIESLNQAAIIRGPFIESASVFLLTEGEEGVVISATESHYLGFHPYVQRPSDTQKKRAAQYRREVINSHQPNIVIMDETFAGEEDTLPTVNHIYDYFGSSLGGEQSLKMYIAYLTLHKKVTPQAILREVNSSAINKIGIFTMTLAGSYEYVQLEVR